MVSRAIDEVKPNISLDQSILNGTDVSSSQSPAAVNPLSALLPPFNADASSPSEIYDLDDIVSREEMEILETVAQSIIGESRAFLTEKGPFSKIHPMMFQFIYIYICVHRYQSFGHWSHARTAAGKTGQIEPVCASAVRGLSSENCTSTAPVCGRNVRQNADCAAHFGTDVGEVRREAEEDGRQWHIQVAGWFLVDV